MHITPVTDRAELAAFHAVEEASLANDHVGLPADAIDEWVPLLTEPESAGSRVLLWVATHHGAPVGSLSLRLPTLDNLCAANVDLQVHPEHRRQGHGRELAAFALQQVRAQGRTRVFLEVATPTDGSPRLGQRLLDEVGARGVLDDVRRMVDLQVHPPARRCAVPAGYRVVQWVDCCPDALVDGVAYLMGRMTLDAPMGDLDYEQEKWDAGRYRDTEQSARDRKRTRIATAVVHEATGQVAGITDIGVSTAQPETGYQWDTIVDPDHRGHGLGLVLKTWNHLLLAESVPAVRYLNTWNAASNTFMIAVNDAMGFVPMESWTEFQLDL